MGTTTRRLSGLDAAFLALETERSTGHVGGLSIIDPATAAEPLDLDRMLRLYAERVPLVPVLRRRLVRLPFGIDQPYWVDDPGFDLTYHVRESALPSPGDDDQLRELVARLHERPLDLDRPLWESHLITGLRGGLVASYIKIHHAAMDGVAGNDLIGALMDLSPEGRDLPPAEAWRPRPLPGPWRLTGRAAADVARRPVEAARIAADVARAVPVALPLVGPAVAPLVSRVLGRGTPDGELLEATAGRAPVTPFNVDITPHRLLGLSGLSLDDVKTVKNAFGVSVNDVVMAVSAGALRAWLLERDALPEHPLVAMVPVSIRTGPIRTGRDGAGGGRELGNKVSAMLAQLPTHLADPVERLHVSHEATQHAKEQQAFIPQGLVDEVSDFAPPALMNRAFRAVFGWHVLNRVPAFNVVVSNVPGPPIPIYLAGAQVLAHYPLSIVTDGLALNITVLSYLGRLHVGLVADRRAVPDVQALADRLPAELDVLLAAARG